MLQLDHVVLAVSDLDVAAQRLIDDNGLASLPGGRHERWGTANRIVPLGETYLELIAVVDSAAASGSRFGAEIARIASDGDGWLTWAVRDDRIAATADRLGLVVGTGSRSRPDGAVLRWRNAGVEDPVRTAELPFFIAWDVPDALHPGRATLDHPCGASGIGWLEVAGDRAALDRWTDHAELPVRHVAGSEGVRAVAVRTPDGVLLLA